MYILRDLHGVVELLDTTVGTVQYSMYVRTLVAARQSIDRTPDYTERPVAALIGGWGNA